MRLTELQRLTLLTGEVKTSLEHAAVFPASHCYVVPMEKILEAAKNIETELEERVRWFKSEDKLWKPSAFLNGRTLILK